MTDFSANSSLIGYIYQVRYALYLALKDENIDKDISIEKLDDVAFETGGAAKELLQIKHHIKKTAQLTNSCSDLWKTLRVWSESIINNQIDINSINLSLVTTGTAPDETIAYYLRDDKNRNPQKACELINEFIKKSNSKNNKVNFESFLKLDDKQQFGLCTAITILDQAPNIEDVEKSIHKRLALSTRPERILPLYERLEGWWFQKVIDHLLNTPNGFISNFEIREMIANIADMLRSDNLPIDFFDSEPYQQFSQDKVIFLEQLNLINIDMDSLSFALKDYYRAFIQRTKWLDDNLVGALELEKYEKKLIEEWKRQYIKINRRKKSVSEEELIENGYQLFDWMNEANIFIRKECTEPYVMRGSYHLIADNPNLKIGWHPEFEKRLREILGFDEVMSS